MGLIDCEMEWVGGVERLGGCGSSEKRRLEDDRTVCTI